MNYTDYRSKVIKGLRQLSWPSGEQMFSFELIVRNFRTFSTWRIDDLSADYWKAEKPIAECIGMCFEYIATEVLP